jgi:hypothetical protein
VAQGCYTNGELKLKLMCETGQETQFGETLYSNFWHAGAFQAREAPALGNGDARMKASMVGSPTFYDGAFVDGLHKD